VPLVAHTDQGAHTELVDLRRARESVAFRTTAQPRALELDPELRLFRRLAPGEAPPILRQAMLDPATAVVLVSGADAARAARTLAGRVLEHAPQVHPATAELPDVPVLAIGLDAEVDAWLAQQGLAPRPTEVAAKGSAQAWAATRRDGRALMVVSGRDAAALEALARPLPHYGRQSWIAFEGAKAIARGLWPSVPQRVRLD